MLGINNTPEFIKVDIIALYGGENTSDTSPAVSFHASSSLGRRYLLKIRVWNPFKAYYNPYSYTTVDVYLKSSENNANNKNLWEYAVKFSPIYPTGAFTNDTFKVITAPNTKPTYTNLDSNRQSMRVDFDIASNKIAAAQFFN